MLAAADIKKIADYLKIKEADLTAAIAAPEETPLTIPEIVVLTKEEQATRDANQLEEGKKLGAKEGETSATPLLLKELGKKLNMEFKSDRIGEIAKEIQGKMNEGNDTKITELQERVNLLSKDKETLEADKLKLVQEKEAVSVDYEIVSDFPKRKGMLTDKEYLNTVKLNYEFKPDGVYKDGVLLRNAATHEAMPRKEAIALLFKERQWVDDGAPAQQGGRGAGDNNPGAGSAGVKSYSQAVEAWKAKDPEKNINPVSPECTDFVAEIASKDPQFDMHS